MGKLEYFNLIESFKERTTKSGHIYIGETDSRGLLDGRGILVKKDKVHIGYLRRGKPNGHCIDIYADGHT